MSSSAIEDIGLINPNFSIQNEPSSKPELKFYIFGHNISHSLSPALHNAGFKELGLPYHYCIYESPDVDDAIERIISRPDFGGASVTYPHKLQAGRLVDYLSSCASTVGAINTIVVESNASPRRLRGDNTDWLGILRCIRKSRHRDLHKTPALVVGAGGAARAACHALQTFGISELTIVNRTRETAEAVAKHFSEFETIHICQTCQEANSSSVKPFGIIISCVPAIFMEESQIPDSLFFSREKNQQEDIESGRGLLIEMAYKPQITNMMKAAFRHSEWDVFRGIDVLEEQAYAQFEMWTGMEAPVEVMGRAMKLAMQTQRNGDK